MSFFLKKKNTNYKTPADLDTALKSSGVLEDLNVMIVFDFTASNDRTGKESYAGKNLHTLDQLPNPYQQMINCLGLLLRADKDGNYPVYANGTKRAALMENNLEFLGLCQNIQQINQVYSQAADRCLREKDMAGPSCIEYIAKEAIRVYNTTKEYQIVFYITDGEPSDNFKVKDIQALREASGYPISFVVFGVGDGPFTYYEGLDDMNTKKMKLSRDQKNELGKLKSKALYDNLQFVDLNREILKGKEMDEEKARQAFFRGFMEVPKQYKKIKELEISGLIARQRSARTRALGWPHRSCSIYCMPLAETPR